MKKIVLFMLLLCLLPFPLLADELYIDSMVIAEGIEDYIPIEAGFTFAPDVEELCCFNKICGATSETTITHIWYWKDEEIIRINLPVGIGSWRTYSSIKILPTWKGHWWVNVVHGEAVLGGIDFTIE